MAVTTTTILVKPDENWKLVATAPNGPILIKPHSTSRYWSLIVAAALPANTELGMPMGRFSGSGEDNQFRTNVNIAQNIYVRVPASSGASAKAADAGLYFTVMNG